MSASETSERVMLPRIQHGEADNGQQILLHPVPSHHNVRKSQGSSEIAIYPFGNAANAGASRSESTRQCIWCSRTLDISEAANEIERMLKSDILNKRKAGRQRHAGPTGLGGACGSWNLRLGFKDEPLLDERCPLPGLGYSRPGQCKCQGAITPLVHTEPVVSQKPLRRKTSRYTAVFEKGRCDYWNYKVQLENLRYAPQRPVSAPAKAKLPVHRSPPATKSAVKHPMATSAHNTTKSIHPDTKQRMKAYEHWEKLVAPKPIQQCEWQNFIAQESLNRGLSHNNTAHLINRECKARLHPNWAAHMVLDLSRTFPWIRQIRNEGLAYELLEGEQDMVYEQERGKYGYHELSERARGHAEDYWIITSPFPGDVLGHNTKWAKKTIAQGTYYQPGTEETNMSADQQRLEAGKEKQRHVDGEIARSMRVADRNGHGGRLGSSQRVPPTMKHLSNVVDPSPARQQSRVAMSAHPVQQATKGLNPKAPVFAVGHGLDLHQPAPRQQRKRRAKQHKVRGDKH